MNANNDPDFAPIAARIRDNVGRQGFMTHIGAELSELTRGTCTLAVDRRPELLRHRATKDLVFENKTTTARHWLKHTLAIAKLPTTARLFLMPSLNLGALRDRFFVRNLRRMQRNFNAVTFLQLLDHRLDVQLSRA